MKKLLFLFFGFGFLNSYIFASDIYADMISQKNFDTYIWKLESDTSSNTKYFGIPNKSSKSKYFWLMISNSLSTWDLQKFKLDNWYVLNYDYSAWDIYISYSDSKWKSKSSNKIKSELWVSMFGYSELVQYSDNKMIINPWWYHEWEWYELLYDSSKNKLINIRTDIYKPLMQKKWLDYPIYDVKIKWNNLVIREYLYCCDTINDPNGNEEITINISKNKIIKKTKVKDSKARDGSRNN